MFFLRFAVCIFLIGTAQSGFLSALVSVRGMVPQLFLALTLALSLQARGMRVTAASAACGVLEAAFGTAPFAWAALLLPLLSWCIQRVAQKITVTGWWWRVTVFFGAAFLYQSVMRSLTLAAGTAVSWGISLRILFVGSFASAVVAAAGYPLIERFGGFFLNVAAQEQEEIDLEEEFA